MINLLPHNAKQSLIFARHNTWLIRLITGISVGIVGIAVVVGCGLFYLQQQTNLYKDSISSSEADLKKQNEAKTIQRVQDISGSLKLVVSVLSKEVIFSDLLRQVGNTMPSGAVLENLSLSNTLFGALDLQAGAVDYQSASQVQVNLQNSKSIFSKVDLVNIACTSDPKQPTPYPCKVTLRALFSDNNNFMLLSPDKKKATS